MEKVDSVRPDWLADDHAVAVAAPASKDKGVPWRTPAAPKPPAPKPVAPVGQPAAAKQRPRRPLWEHVLPLGFLLLFVLVVGGYLAGWHLG